MPRQLEGSKSRSKNESNALNERISNYKEALNKLQLKKLNKEKVVPADNKKTLFDMFEKIGNEGKQQRFRNELSRLAPNQKLKVAENLSTKKHDSGNTSMTKNELWLFDLENQVEKTILRCNKIPEIKTLGIFSSHGRENKTSSSESQCVVDGRNLINRSKKISSDSAIEMSYLKVQPACTLNAIDTDNDCSSYTTSSDDSDVEERKTSVINTFLNSSHIALQPLQPRKRKSLMPVFQEEPINEIGDGESGYFDDMECRLFSADSNNNNTHQFRTLDDITSSELMISRNRSTSMNTISSGDTYIPDDKPRLADLRPRRKLGLGCLSSSNIISLDQLPKRRLSRSNEFFYRSADDETVISESLSSRRKSTVFLNFDELESDGLEVVADNETRDIISDSHETLTLYDGSNCYRSTNKSNRNAFHKIPVDEETSNESSRATSAFTSFDEEEKDKENNSLDVKKETEQQEEHIKMKSLKFQQMYSLRKACKRGTVFYERKLSASECKSTTFSTMFGYFNFSLYNFISKEYGNEKWKEIAEKTNLTKRQLAMFEKPKHSLFDDEVTHNLLKTSAKNLRINFNLFLQKFGTRYFEFCCTKYGDVLKSIATNLCDFINNMDDIRQHIHKIEKIADDYAPSIYATLDNRGTLMLYYHWNRDQQCLDYFLVGFIKAAARVLYGMRTRVSLHESRKVTTDYSVISIKAVTSLVKKPSALKLQLSSRSKDLFMEPFQMDHIFPFHIILDSRLNICQLGGALNKFLEHLIPKYGLNIKNYFKIDRPIINFTYGSIENNLNTAFILTSVDGIQIEGFKNGLQLKGQIAKLECSQCLWFIGSPKVDLISQLNGENKLFLSDIPIHDATREVLLVNERTNEQDSLKTQLQILTNRLKEISKELALSKINTENILDDIFPKDVAERLMRNLPVPAVTKEEVSILFTDIVGFTSICEKSDPEDVTDMLNNLYVGFDLLCETFEVYKVETIGDAYMAVAGIHQKDKEHGRCTTTMGINMIRHAKEVLSPAGSPVEIRVGIHSGSVVAGVVGTRMPRYCLFGNNVSFANKMESTSESGKVHISPATYREIKHHEEFVFFARDRDVMPTIMQKLYSKHTYFVSTRKTCNFERPCHEQPEKRKNFMMPRKTSDEYLIMQTHRARSRRTSCSESVFSDHNMYPDELKKQLDALDLLNGYQNGNVFSLPKIGAL